MATVTYLSNGFIRDFEIVGDTKQDVLDQMNKMYQGYPTAGYGTTIKYPEHRLDGTWYATGYHYESCD